MSRSLISLLFLVITVSWMAEFILFRNRGTSEGEMQERRSYPFLLFVIALTISMAVLMREWNIFYVGSTLVHAAGIVLYASGVLLRYWGIFHLKEQFTRHVSFRKGDELVSSGPYRRLRHPLYTGLLLIIIGICLSLGNAVLAGAGGTAAALGLLKRIRIEEKMLIEAYGEEYRSWAEKRYRLVPPIY